MDELNMLQAWAMASPERRGELAWAVAELHGLTVTDIGTHRDSATPIASLRQEPSGVLFRLIPGGTYRMGLSDEEQRTLERILAAAQESEGPVDEGGTYVDPDFVEWLLADVDVMRPVRNVTVAPFMIARHPLTVAQVQALDAGYGAVLHKQPPAPYQAASLRDDELTALEKVWPFRLPTETEWEYAARAGTTALTYRGDLVPREQDLIDRFHDDAATVRDENQFGLSGIGSCEELCADVYVAGYAGAPTDGSARRDTDGRRVHRGGAMAVSPWQGCGEWTAMLSATRRAVEFDHTVVRPALSV